ncbi:SDR family oxidoreductase [Spirillospora sp. NPDC127200]
MATILVTGGSGAVGSLLVPRLAARHDLIALSHRSRIPDAANISGDLGRPRLGLDAARYRELAARTELIVHGGASVDFGQPLPVLRQTNVQGTAHVLELAAVHRIPVIYISTAAVAWEDKIRQSVAAFSPRKAADPLDYLATKGQAERLAHDSGLPVAVVRPSVLIGDSRSGRLAVRQSLQHVLAAILRGRLPVLSLTGAEVLEVVPVDLVAEAIAALADVLLADAGHAPADYWLTSGDAAPQAGDTLTAMAAVMAGLGRRWEPPELVPPPQMARRLAESPDGAGRLHLADVAVLASTLAHDRPLPTSLGAIPGGPPAPTRSLLTSAMDAHLRDLAVSRRRRPSPAPI